MITRELSIEIIPLLDFFPCVAILGSRQVGKTTFVKNLQPFIDKPILYLDLEDTNDYEILSTNAQWFLTQNKEKLIIIDEIQRETKLFPLLRSLIDKQDKPGQLILLGSASPELLAKSSETLAGRIVYKELTPLTRFETLQYSQEEHWFRGGYPKAFLAPNDFLWQQWHQAYLKTYVETDLRMLGLNASPILITKLLRMIASIQGSVINYSMLGNALGITSVQVKKYIDFLEHSFIIRRIEPFYINIGKRLVKSPKIYIRDTGILHSILQINSYDELISNPIAGNSWEGYVIEQIISKLNSNCTPYFYRTQSGAEVDMCITKGNEIIATIEIKLSNNPKISRGNTESINDLKTKSNFIVTFGNSDYQLNEFWKVVDLKTLYKELKKLNITK
ncbi:MAG: ATP-binding protein [Flavobacterium sp.]|uniref:ATP-binding protein n=1 Tax=Flavobacterium sp. TaxID=239 RepID=UPI0022CD1EB9|nr:ATP-binding protein [Flavobacterium sp.]MCZ8197448.1 ATP-binding protein [Flavobacterium sp.]